MSKILLTDFGFIFNGYGRYIVTYYEPGSGKAYSKTITDMEIIDKTKNSNNPKVKDLNTLKRMCKNK